MTLKTKILMKKNCCICVEYKRKKIKSEKIIAQLASFNVLPTKLKI